MRGWIVFIVTTLFATLSFAQEPVNIAVIKKELVQYHDSGEYEKDINAVIENAMTYLKARISHPMKKKPLIVLDIDETALSNYKHMREMGFGGSLNEIQRTEMKADDPAIPATQQLYQFAKRHHIAVAFVTGRPDGERDATAKNLHEAGYDEWDALVFRSTAYQRLPVASYKTAIRKKFVSEGYDVILNIGDQMSDLKGKFADKSLKLPNPFYFIP